MNAKLNSCKPLLSSGAVIQIEVTMRSIVAPSKISTGIVVIKPLKPLKPSVILTRTLAAAFVPPPQSVRVNNRPEIKADFYGVDTYRIP